MAKIGDIAQTGVRSRLGQIDLERTQTIKAKCILCNYDLSIVENPRSIACISFLKDQLAMLRWVTACGITTWLLNE